MSHDLSVCMSSVTLVHSAVAVGRNEIPFRRDTRVIPDYIVLDTAPGPPTGRGDLGVGTLEAMVLIAKLLWSNYFYFYYCYYYYYYCYY